MSILCELFELDVYEAMLPAEENMLTYLKLEIPRFIGDAPCKKRINKFYKKKKNRLISYYTKESKTSAKTVFKKTEAYSPPVSIELSCEIADESEIYINILRKFTSKYNDIVYENYFAEVWDKATGNLITLNDLLPADMRNQRQIINAVYKSCSSINNVRFYDKQKKYISKFFDKDSFYIYHDRIFIFFQPGTLAPVECGIVTIPISIEEK